VYLLIAGGGKVGSNLARGLIRNGHITGTRKP
jgi:Trk K+ transport system NAD-binding subunit